MTTKIQLRRDTAVNWTSTNPILSQGEMGVETDTGNFKIGNGNANWTELAYAVPYAYSNTDVDLHLNTSTASAGEHLTWSGVDYDWAALPSPFTTADVDSHINTGSATSGEYLSWNGTQYSWEAIPAGYSDSDVNFHLNTGTATANQVLSWDGTDYDWIDGGGGAAAQVSVTAVGTSGNFKIPFIDLNSTSAPTGDYGLQIDNTSGDFYYNPSLNRLYADNFVGNGSLLTGITASSATYSTYWNNQGYSGGTPISGDILASNGSGWQDFALTAGANVTISQDNNARTITIASSGGGGGGGATWYSLNTSSPMTLPADFDSSFSNMSSTKAMAWGADTFNTLGNFSPSWNGGSGSPQSRYWMNGYDPSSADLQINGMGTGNYVIISTHYDSSSWSSGSAFYTPSSGFGSNVGNSQLSSFGDSYFDQEAWGMTILGASGATVTGGEATVAETFELYPGSNKTAFLWSLDNTGCQNVYYFQDALQFSTSAAHETIYFHRYKF